MLRAPPAGASRSPAVRPGHRFPDACSLARACQCSSVKRPLAQDPEAGRSTTLRSCAARQTRTNRCLVPRFLLRIGRKTTWGLSRFSRGENGTVPLRDAEVILRPLLIPQRKAACPDSHNSLPHHSFPSSSLVTPCLPRSVWRLGDAVRSGASRRPVPKLELGNERKGSRLGRSFTRGEVEQVSDILNSGALPVILKRVEPHRAEKPR